MWITPDAVNLGASPRRAWAAAQRTVRVTASVDCAVPRIVHGLAEFRALRVQPARHFAQLSFAIDPDRVSQNAKTRSVLVGP